MLLSVLSFLTSTTSAYFTTTFSDENGLCTHFPNLLNSACTFLTTVSLTPGPPAPDAAPTQYFVKPYTPPGDGIAIGRLSAGNFFGESDTRQLFKDKWTEEDVTSAYLLMVNPHVPAQERILRQVNVSLVSNMQGQSNAFAMLDGHGKVSADLFVYFEDMAPWWVKEDPRQTDTVTTFIVGRHGKVEIWDAATDPQLTVLIVDDEFRAIWKEQQRREAEQKRRDSLSRLSRFIEDAASLWKDFQEYIGSSAWFRSLMDKASRLWTQLQTKLGSLNLLGHLLDKTPDLLKQMQRDFVSLKWLRRFKTEFFYYNLNSCDITDWLWWFVLIVQVYSWHSLLATYFNVVSWLARHQRRALNAIVNAVIAWKEERDRRSALIQQSENTLANGRVKLRPTVYPPIDNDIFVLDLPLTIGAFPTNDVPLSTPSAADVDDNAPASANSTPRFPPASESAAGNGKRTAAFGPVGDDITSILSDNDVYEPSLSPIREEESSNCDRTPAAASRPAGDDIAGGDSESTTEATGTYKEAPKAEEEAVVDELSTIMSSLEGMTSKENAAADELPPPSADPAAGDKEKEDSASPVEFIQPTLTPRTRFAEVLVKSRQERRTAASQAAAASFARTQAHLGSETPAAAAASSVAGPSSQPPTVQPEVPYADNGGFRPAGEPPSQATLFRPASTIDSRAWNPPPSIQWCKRDRLCENVRCVDGHHHLAIKDPGSSGIIFDLHNKCEFDLKCKALRCQYWHSCWYKCRMEGQGREKWVKWRDSRAEAWGRHGFK